MKTKKIIVALLALGAFLTSNAQTPITYSPATGPSNSTSGTIIQFPLVTSETADGLTWYPGGNPQNYGIYKTQGKWEGPAYQQLKIAWQAGIIIDGYSTAWGSSKGGTTIQPNGGEVRIGNTVMPIGAKNWKPTEVTIDGIVKIGLGSISPLAGDNSYSLYVAKGILTEQVKVSVLAANWSDYVFAKDYTLKPLKEVESYIKANKHLPDVPSANEMASKGLDVAKSDALLLQKIEELTLYMIQLQKQNEGLQKQVDALKK